MSINTKIKTTVFQATKIGVGGAYSEGTFKTEITT